MEKVITGNWNGEPIWRQKLPSDYLEEEIAKNELLTNEKENGQNTKNSK